MAPPGHAARIRAIVGAFLRDNPHATFQEVCDHLEARGLIVADKEMLRGFLSWKGK
jgi:hypothetical protein